MISVTVDTKNVDNMLLKLTGNLSITSFKNFANQTVTPYVRLKVGETFDTEGGRLGGWKELSSYTIERKGGSRILYDRGNLRSSIEKITEKSQGYEASWGPEGIKGSNFRGRRTNAKVYGYHQTGTSRMPKRQILGWTEGDRNTLADYFERHIMKGL